MKNNFHEKRRNFYIKKEFQRNFILKFCFIVVMGAIISGVIIYSMSTSTVTTTFENSRLTIRNTADYILPSVLLSSVIVIVLVGLATIFVTMLTSHKIGGALYAIEKHVEQVSAGNLQTKFRLRSDDEIKALAVGMDVMVHNMRESVQGIKNAVSNLESASSITELANSSSDFQLKLQQLKISVDRFKT